MKSMLIRGLILLVVIQGVIIIGHLWVYRTMLKALYPAAGQGPYGLKVGVVSLALAFLVTSVLANNFVGSIINGLYTFAAVWMGTFYWLFLAAVAYWPLRWLIKIIYAGNLDFVLGIVLFGAALLLSAYGLCHSYQTRVAVYDIRVPNLPEFWQGKKVAFVSDTHLGNIRGKRFIEKIAKLIDSQKPEILLIPGDYFDGPPADYRALAKGLSDNVKPPQGIYFTSGNHEEFRDSQAYLDALAAAGIKIINNQVADISGLQFIGTDYSGNNSNDGLKATLSAMRIDTARPSIMLKHAPLAVQAAADAGVGIMVSGHTHRGQVWPLGYITRWVHKGFDYGLNRYANLNVVTSSGAGTWGPPQRVGTQSEVVVIRLEAM